MSGRLVLVLGYSNGRNRELHAVCAARLRRAERATREGDVVLLSGWARGRRGTSEAELMARSWRGRPARILLDQRARSTLGNVAGAVATARAVDAREIVLVTSSWHGHRSRALLAAALRGSDIGIVLAPSDEGGGTLARLREAACWALVPLQVVLAPRRARASMHPQDGARVEAR